MRPWCKSAVGSRMQQVLLDPAAMLVCKGMFSTYPSTMQSTPGTSYAQEHLGWGTQTAECVLTFECRYPHSVLLGSLRSLCEHEKTTAKHHIGAT